MDTCTRKAPSFSSAASPAIATEPNEPDVLHARRSARETPGGRCPGYRLLTRIRGNGDDTLRSEDATSSSVEMNGGGGFGRCVNVDTTARCEA